MIVYIFKIYLVKLSDVVMVNQAVSFLMNYKYKNYFLIEQFWVQTSIDYYLVYLKEVFSQLDLLICLPF